MAYVYKHTRLDKNEVFYIGIAKATRKRRAFEERGRNSYWVNVVNKTDYSVEIVKEGLTWEDACKLETELIKKYGRKDLKEGTLVNMTDGGDGTPNVSEEVKLKKSTMYSGKRNPMYGKEHTEESKRKMSEAKKGQLLGVPKPNGFGEKIRKSRIGKSLSEETKQKIREVNLGKKLTEEHKEKLRKASKEWYEHNENPRKGKHHTEKSKKKISETILNKPKLECPHCHKKVDPGNAKQWHFDKCRYKENK